ncbi:MAG: hypothetical protein AAF550_14395, partial [Myxococcota bacterium]
LELIFVAGGLQIEARKEDQAENAPSEDHEQWREKKLTDCIEYAKDVVASSQSGTPETPRPPQANEPPQANDLSAATHTLQELCRLINTLDLREALHPEMGRRAYLRKAYGSGEKNPHNEVFDRETYAAGVQIPLPLFDTAAFFSTGRSHLLPKTPGIIPTTAYMFRERDFLGLRPRPYDSEKSMRRDIDVRWSTRNTDAPVVRSPIVQESYVRAATKALFSDYSARVQEGLMAYLEMLLLVAVIEALETETVIPRETRSATPLPIRSRKRWWLHPNRPRDVSPQANTLQANAARVTPKEWTLALDSLRWFGFWYQYNRYLRHIATERRVEEEKLFELLVSRVAAPYAKSVHKEIHAHILKSGTSEQLRTLFDCIEKIRKDSQLQKQFGSFRGLRSDDWTGKTLLTPAGQWLSRLRALTLFACLKFRPGAAVIDEDATVSLDDFWKDTESPQAMEGEALQSSKWAASLKQVYDLAIELPDTTGTGAINPRRDALDQEMYQRAFRRGRYRKQNPCAAWLQASRAQAHPSSATQCFQDEKFFFHLKFLRDSARGLSSIARQRDYNPRLIPWPSDYFNYASNTDLHSGLRGRPLDFRRYFLAERITVDSTAPNFIEATEELLLRSLERVSIANEADSWANQLTTLQRRFAAHAREQMTAKVIPPPPNLSGHGKSHFH